MDPPSFLGLRLSGGVRGGLAGAGCGEGRPGIECLEFERDSRRGEVGRGPLRLEPFGGDSASFVTEGDKESV
jgi:hypothetical protein